MIAEKTAGIKLKNERSLNYGLTNTLLIG